MTDIELDMDDLMKLSKKQLANIAIAKLTAEPKIQETKLSSTGFIAERVRKLKELGETKTQKEPGENI